ncbi:hypothetical protein ABN028_35005 [Actinopolymorpha sp. B17G11]|uniref:hypothetical protein n=1 Tax=Actinopolymorpha sp. B17G11 TaxID=3160861 RepID=UPI0032E39B3D
MQIDPPRPLSTAERLILDLVLTPEFTGVEQLREQAQSAVVVGCCECGCPTIDLMVPGNPRRTPVAARLAPSEGEVVPTGDEPPGQVILFIDDGELSRLEYVWFDEPPNEWPDPSRVRVVAAPTHRP